MPKESAKKSERSKSVESNSNVQELVKGEKVAVYGAKTHNLKNIDVLFPKNKLVVVCGVSGSGKSSFAFDTVFAEGQRRYVESLSAYARQFLGQIDKPDVERIEGLSPAVAIDQKSVNHNPRSTVGTVTEVWDHFRLLWSRIGIPYCQNCNLELKRQSTSKISETVSALYPEESITILAPLVRDRKGGHSELLIDLVNKGYSRVRIDGTIVKLSEVKEVTEPKKKHDLEAVIDRIKVSAVHRERLSSSIETATKLSNGFVYVLAENGIHKFATALACSECGESREPLEPRAFSFNSPYGACEACDGLGSMPTVEESLVVSDYNLTLREGAITVWGQSSGSNHYLKLLKGVTDKYGGSLDVPYKQLPKRTREVIFEGDEDLKIKTEFATKYTTREYLATFEGLNSWLLRRVEDASEGTREKYQQYFVSENCKICVGGRLNASALSVLINQKNISEIAKLTIDDCAKFIAELKLSTREAQIAERLVKEIKERLNFLLDVGLSYLTLDRTATTLSGGESQRIRLATQIGSGLTGVLYVLDEPSIGLHQRDNDRLLETLKKLRDLGNTVLVVEHDEETLKNSDWVIEIGPKAGANGGELVWSGNYKKFLVNKKSLTASYLRGEKVIARNQPIRTGNGQKIVVQGAEGNNLQKVKLSIPLGTMVTVTGVSGSGKSTLINDTLARILAREINGSRVIPSKYSKVSGLENIDKMVVIDQSPIGRTPRSNPATYVGLFDQVRTLFSMTESSRVKGYQPGRFSFNVPTRNGGGRCEVCQGDGTIRIAMNFLPDVYVKCESCNGKRYNEETLSVKYNGKNIAEILEMPISEANEFFAKLPPIKRHLQLMVDVGLGYLQLGQSSTTLSGGEAQRIKLASELSKRSTGKTLYILDEPTTGLHFDDVYKLVEVLQKLVNQGNTVVIIEHNLDVIKVSDHVIDLGPEGGPGGGKIVGEGTPEEIAQLTTPTGLELNKFLNAR